MSDLLDVAPSLPRYGEEGEGALLQGRTPSMGEYLRANVNEGFWGTTTDRLVISRGQEIQGDRADPTPLSREEWESSGLARRGLSWDERMTRGRAEAMARRWDDNSYRRALMQARDPSAFETALGFGGQLVGSLFDPVNFVPFVGAARLGLKAGGALRAAAFLDRPGVVASALRGAADATLGNAAVMPALYVEGARYGEEITFDKVVADLAMGAIVGGAFGTLGGLLNRQIQPNTMTSVRVLDQAASDIAAGRPLEVPAALATRTLDDAVVRSAPIEMQGLRVQDLPAGPDGAPLTRAEFDAWAAQAGRDAPELLPLAAREAPAARSDEGAGPTMRASDEAPRAVETAAPEPQPATIEGPGRQAATPEAQPMAAARPDSLTPEAARAPDAPAVRGGSAPVEPAPAAPAPPTPEMIAATREAMGAESYAWYREALDARRQMERMASAPMPRESTGQNPQNASGYSAESASAVTTTPGPEAQHIEAMRAEGRLTAADEAILRAGDDAAAELQGVAKGLKEAAECLLRNMR